MTAKRATATTEALQNMTRLVAAYAETLPPDVLLNLSASVATGIRETMISLLPVARDERSAGLTLSILVHAEVARMLNREAVSILGIDRDNKEAPGFEEMLNELMGGLEAALLQDLHS